MHAKQLKNTSTYKFLMITSCMYKFRLSWVVCGGVRYHWHILEYKCNALGALCGALLLYKIAFCRQHYFRSVHFTSTQGIRFGEKFLQVVVLDVDARPAEPTNEAEGPQQHIVRVTHTLNNNICKHVVTLHTDAMDLLNTARALPTH